MTDRRSTLLQSHFGANARKYTDSAGHAQGDDLSLMVDHLPISEHRKVLDAATGTGHTALALAPKVERVVGIDAVPQMLDEAARAAQARGIRNVEWVLGAVERTGFEDATFDIVTCRRAAHHFADVSAFLGEAYRVLRPGGALGIVDQVAPEDAAAAAVTEHMEKIHDPSHNRALSPSAWRAVVRRAGFRQAFDAVQDERRTIDNFLTTSSDRDEKRAAIERVLRAAPAEALEKIGYQVTDGVASFIKRRWIGVCRKAANHPDAPA